MKCIIKRFTILFISLVVLTACGSKVELSDYIEVEFNGYDSIGTAHYTINDDQLVEDVFGVTEENYWELEYEQTQEINDLMMSFSAELSQANDLSNGDEIIVRLTVDEEMTNKLKTKDEMTVTVSGLDEPTELSDEEIERNVIVNFNGISGRGRIQIDTTFDGELYDLWVEADQDGEIANGDIVRVSLAEESRDSLAYMGYALSGDGAAEFEASGLEVVAENANEIENLADLKRMMDEGVNRRYQDSDWGYYTYEIIEGSTYYRQFEPVSEGEWGASNTHGRLITLYTINEYDSDDELINTLTAIQGFSNIILDENGQTNVTQIIEYQDNYDHTYSLDSVEKLMEGYGFELVE